MTPTETIQEFYQRVPQANRFAQSPDNGGRAHFNVFARGSCLVSPYSRRDYYKVSLIIGAGRLHYANRWINVNRPALLFSNPVVPYAWEAASPEQSGWFCLFTPQFLQHGESQGSLQESPLFAIGSDPVFFVDEKQERAISDIFQKMVVEIGTDYLHKYDVLRNLLYLLIHEAMKMRPASSYERYRNASSRVASLFLELMERQFPIDSPGASLKLRTARDYAKSLSLHVNSLNRSIKEVTGKTTTEHISERIVREASALLRHTDWNIAEIAYGLGFEEPAYFTSFFKKHTGRSPNGVRKKVV